MDYLDRRRTGILLHPTSLPGRADHGDLGHSAYRFIEFLTRCGISLWQLLPLGPTHEDNSPYQCLSVHAGDPALISLEWLEDRNWLDINKIRLKANDPAFRQQCLFMAWRNFKQYAEALEMQQFEVFCQQQANWLDDYALYMAIRQKQHNKGWTDWPTALRDREPESLSRLRSQLADKLNQIRFEQYVFFTQWLEIKHYANQHGIGLFGDMPIFVAHDSADVWANRENFLLDETGQPRVVAGVPPDYFSETGQRWGNPHYNWQYMQEHDFDWWHLRMQTQLQLFDVIRVDHFRGFEAYWEIPAEAETAIDGRWVKAPGEALLNSLHDHFGNLPLVAEDLGIITEEVEALRRQFKLPGMKILQFAFDGNADNVYLPHNHETNCVVYTGTHDNDTTLGWYQALNTEQQQIIDDYLGYAAGNTMPWPLNRTTLASVARLAVLPMQDILGLGEGQRMNTPGTTEGNWQWRFQWEQIPEGLEEKLMEMVGIYGRK